MEPLLLTGARVDDTVSGVRVPETTLHSDIFPVWLSVRSWSREQHVGIGVAGNLGGRRPRLHGDRRDGARLGAELLYQAGQAVHADAGQPRTAQHREDGTEATPPARLFSSSP